MDDEDDPVIASYDVYLTEPSAANTQDASSKIYVLQYPSHRRYTMPYNAATSQTPSSLRVKAETGFLEMDVPLLTHSHYNADAGEKYGKAMAESRTLQAGGTLGLAGGFNSGSGHLKSREVPTHDHPNGGVPWLATQTLGGKIVEASPRDPVYLVGCFHQDQIHLSHVDAVVQMRPQFLHLDAEDEVNQKRFQANNAPGPKQKTGLEPAAGAAAKVESKAIEIKIKDSKEDPKDRSLNENARMLRDIQVEEWRHHEWIDEHDEEATAAFERRMHLVTSLGHPPVKLESSLSNGDWLDKMSAPREDGKKGLLAKLRGRERERARRKKAEEEKRQRQKETTGAATSSHGPLLDMSSDSDLSSPDASDSETAEDNTMSQMRETNKVAIKEEPSHHPPLSTTTQRPSASASTASNLPKKRGRPKKTQAADAMQLDD